jgi:hypothetical protein
VAATIVLGACGGFDELTLQAAPAVAHTVTFVGYVYDGAVGARLTEYTIRVLVANDSQTGKVDPDGRYVLGPVSAWDDFTIVIDAGGYRPFLSHNAHIGLPPELDGSDAIDDIGTSQTRHYDAYVFPGDLLAPGVTFTIKTDVPDAKPSGMMRLRPVSFSVIANESEETPSGVPGQLWTNDEDLQANSIARVFTDGKVSVTAEELVYGVTYQIDIYDVADYQPFQAYYLAGKEGDKTFTLVEEATEPITLLSSTAAACKPPGAPGDPSAAVVTLTLNHDVELAESPGPGGYAEILDDGLQISSPDKDADGEVNTLAPDDSSVDQERHTTLTVSGKTVKLEWCPKDGLSVKDADDPFEWVRYNSLHAINVQRLGKPASAVSLGAVVGKAEITCSADSP